MNFKLKLWPTHWAGGSAHWPINRIFLEATGDGKIPVARSLTLSITDAETGSPSIKVATRCVQPVTTWNLLRSW